MGRMMTANLLFLYGPSWSGKTRLLQMIAESCNERSIMRVGSEQIVHDMMHCFENRNYNDFFDKYTSVKDLLVDNIWILRSRPNAAKEIGRLINERVKLGNLTRLASDLVCRDVVRTLPAIGDCLEKNGAIYLSLSQREPEGYMASLRVSGQA